MTSRAPRPIGTIRVPFRSAARAFAIVATLTLAATGCANTASDSADPVADTGAGDASSTLAEHDLAFDSTDEMLSGDVNDDADGAAISDDVTDDGVLEAAIIILTAGDLEAALAEGRITESEVDAAIEALDDGTLAFYVG